MASNEIKVLINAQGSVKGIQSITQGLTQLRTQAAQTQLAVQKSYQINFPASRFNAVAQGAANAVQGLNKLSPAFQNIKASSIASGAAIKSSFNLTAIIPGLDKMKNAIGGVSGAFSALRVVAVGGALGSAFIGTVGAAVQKSVELENALLGVRSVATAFGVDANKVKDAVVDFTKDGLVGATDAALAFKQVLSTGTDLPTAIKLLNSLKDTAALNRQSFYSLGEAIIATTEGIKNGNSVKADAVGVTKNLSVLEKEYAASINKTVGSLTDQEKIQARVVGFIREGAFAQGDAAKVAGTFGGRMSQLTTQFGIFLARLGDFVTQSKGVLSVLTTLTNGFKFFADVLKLPGQDDRIKSIRLQLNGFLKDVENSPYKDKLLAELKLLEGQASAQRASAIENKKKIELQQLEVIKTKELGEIEKKRGTELKALRKSLTFAGQDDLKKLESQYNKNEKLIRGEKDYYKLKIDLDKKYQFEKEKLEQTAFDKALERAKESARIQKQVNDAILTGASDPLTGTFKKNENGGLSLRATVPDDVKAAGKEKEFQNRADIGRGIGLANAVAGGKEGARGLVVAGAAAGLDMVLPGLGQAAKPLLDAFSQGPEATKQMVKEFAGALPDIIEGFIAAIPVFIEELANQIPVIIERLAEKAPAIIVALIKALPKVTLALMTMFPKLALTFVQEIVKNVPKIITGFINGLISGAGKFISALIDKLTGGASSKLGNKPGGGGIMGALTTGPTGNGAVNLGLNVLTFGGSGIATSLLGGGKGKKKFFGLFADGGGIQSVRGNPGFVDSVPAQLNAGEVVLDRSTSEKFKSFIDKGGSGDNALMQKILDVLSQPMQVETAVQLNQREFANIILNLSRTQQRLA